MIEIQPVGQVDMEHRIDQIRRRIAAIEEKIGMVKTSGDFQTKLEREIARQEKAANPPTQAVPDTPKLPGANQPVNQNDAANSAKVAQALRDAEKNEQPQAQPAPKKTPAQNYLPGEEALPGNVNPTPQQTPASPPEIERIEFPDTELEIPNRDDKVFEDTYQGEDAAPTTVEGIIMRTAYEYGVDPQLVKAIATAESNMNQEEISPVGAIGVMQLMPKTAAGLGVNPYDLNENIDGGTRYLKEMLDTFDGDVPLAVAAYNAGPGAVKRYGGIPPYSETQNYVGRVMDMYQ